MSVFENLLVVYSGIVIINVILSVVLWAKARTVQNRLLVLVWATAVGSAVTQGMLSNSPLLTVVGFASTLAPSIAQARLLASIVDIPFRQKSYLLATGGTLITAFIAHELGAPFWLYALPVAVTVAAPLFIISLRSLFQKSDRLTTVGKALVVSCLVFCIHNIDFVFFGDRPDAAAPGMSVALLIIFATSITAPAVVLERVTEERGRIEQLRSLQEKFFANISHDLRTPATLTLAPLDALLESSGDLTTDQEKMMRRARRNALRLLRLLDDILTLTKIEANGFELQRKTVDVGGLLLGIAEQVRPMAERKELLFESDTKPGVLPYLQADEVQLERAVLNLVANALKFTPSGGRVELRAQRTNGHVRISVIDTGVGISEQELPRIFERFHQTADTKHRRSGSGLGVALTKEIVELHGGRLDVESTPGVGSKFSIVLPVEPEGAKPISATSPLQDGSAQEIAEDKPRAERSDWHDALREEKAYRFMQIHDAVEGTAVVESRAPSKPHILVVEDNGDMRQFVVDVLSGEYDVTSAEDGERGLAEVRKHLPDAIVSDIGMPNMDGLQLAQLLRNDDKTKHIPIVFLTGRHEQEDRARGHQAGSDVYLTKPFHPNELRSVVKRLIDRQKTVREVANDDRDTALRMLAAGVAHEILNPLGFLQNSLAALRLVVRRATAPEAPAGDDLRSDAEKIYASGQEGIRRVRDAVEDLRRFARSANQTSRSKVAIGEVVQNVLTLVQTSDEKGSIRTSLRSTSAVSATRGELEKVLLNLIINARHACGDTGRIDVETWDEPDNVALSVTDNGPGVPSDIRERIFHPFFTTKAPGKGTGLGLSLGRQVIREHGGSLTLDDAPGGGARFTIRLPRIKDEI